MWWSILPRQHIANLCNTLILLQSNTKQYTPYRSNKSNMYISKNSLLSLLVCSGYATHAAAAADDEVESTTTKSSLLRGHVSSSLNLYQGPYDAATSTYDTLSSSLSSQKVEHKHLRPRILQTSVGCYKPHEVGTPYIIDSYVSAAVSDSAFPNYEMDSETGQWVDTNSEDTTTYNYKCISINRCGDQGYGPGEAGESLAWEKIEECNPTEPMQEAPELDLWDDIYCPKTFDSSEDIYDGGEVRMFDGVVYRCAAAPQNIFCSMEGEYNELMIICVLYVHTYITHLSYLMHIMHIYFMIMILGYEPDKYIHFSTVWVWEQLGRCEGTFAPTPNPINTYDDIGGCYCEYDADKTYAAGDRVSKREDGARVVYECKNSPVDQWCDMIVSTCSVFIYPALLLYFHLIQILSRYPTLINQTIQTYEPGEGDNWNMVSDTHLVSSFFLYHTYIPSHIYYHFFLPRHGILLVNVKELFPPPPPQAWTI